MNRTTAIFLAVALLFAHVLAIYNDVDRSLAPPGDEAHAAAWIARNASRSGAFEFAPGVHGLAAHPSPIWLAAALTAEVLGLTSLEVQQWLSIACGLLTVVVLARVGPSRTAGIIAPSLYVLHGAAATATADGTEATLFGLTLAVAFLCWRRRRSSALGIALALACAVRPEGALFALAFALMAVVSRREPNAIRLAPVVVPCAATLAIVCAARALAGGAWLAPELTSIARADGADVRRGLAYLWDFARVTGSPLLFALGPLALLLRGQAARGRDTLCLAALGLALLALQGGSSRPFGAAVAPFLPLVFLSVQEAFIALLDVRRWLEPVVWLLLASAGAASGLAGKHPGHMGPFPMPQAVLDFRRASPRTAEAFGPELVREDLHADVRATRRLRCIGKFLRDHAPPGATTLSPWPGALAYMSRKPVRDLLGRATPDPGSGAHLPWTGWPRVDLLAALAEPADFAITWISEAGGPGTLREVARAWSRSFDARGGEPGRAEAIETALRPYELIVVPIPTDDGLDRDHDHLVRPQHLLRRLELGLGPRLEVRAQGRAFWVRLRHVGHEQLADLIVRFEGADDRAAEMRPIGLFAADARVAARTDLRLYDTGTRAVDLVTGSVPAELGAGRLRVWLQNPDVDPHAEPELGAQAEAATLGPVVEVRVAAAPQ